MKKIFILSTISLLIIFTATAQTVHAALLTDVNGVYIDLGDEGSVTGGGISLLWDMPRYFDDERVYFYINSTFAFNVEKRNEPAETVRSYYPLSAGFEYRYQITGIPLYITGSAGAGASYFRKEGPAYFGGFMDPSKTQIYSDFGPYGDMMLGINFILSQNAAFYAKAGYQKSYYNDDVLKSPSGMQLTAGIRIPISSSHKSFN